MPPESPACPVRIAGTTEPRPRLDRMAVLLNEAAGSNGARARRDAVADAFARHGSAPRIEVVPAAQMRRVVRRLLREGVETLVAAGGDGTVGTVAGALLGGAGTLGVLPLGTFNHFARDAGIPVDLEEAVETVCRGEVCLVDAAQVNGRTFLNNASLGVYTDQVRLRDRLRPRVGRPLASVWAGLVALRRFRSLRIGVEFEGRRFRRTSPLAIVGNGEYGIEAARPIDRGRLDAGVLSLYLFTSRDRLGLVTAVLTGLAGYAERLSRFEAHRVERATLHVRRRHVSVALDGEVVRLRPPLCFRTLPGALRLIGPGRRA